MVAEGEKRKGLFGFFDEVAEHRYFYLILVGICLVSTFFIWLLGVFFDFEHLAEDTLLGSPFFVLINILNGENIFNSLINFLLVSIATDVIVDKILEIYFKTAKIDMDSMKFQKPIYVLLVPLKCLLFTLASLYLPSPDFMGFFTVITDGVFGSNSNPILVLMQILLFIWALRLAGVATIYLFEYLVSSVISSFVSIIGIVITAELIEDYAADVYAFINESPLGIFIIVMVFFYLIDAILPIEMFTKSKEKIKNVSILSLWRFAKDMAVFTVVGWILFGGVCDIAVHNKFTVKVAFTKYLGLSKNEFGKTVMNVSVLKTNIIATLIYNVCAFIFPVVSAIFFVFALFEDIMPLYVSLPIACIFLIAGLFFKNVFAGIHEMLIKLPGKKWTFYFAKNFELAMRVGHKEGENWFMQHCRYFKRIVFSSISILWREIGMILSTLALFPWVHNRYINRVKAIYPESEIKALVKKNEIKVSEATTVKEAVESAVV